LWAAAYVNSLELAIAAGLKTVAFPSISTGAYGYPVELASRVALGAVKAFLTKKEGVVEVVFVLFSQADLQIYRAAAAEVFGQ
jgi:O-acetyl-ADP-ribose deacetylase (regulator of RNase III)